MLKDCQTNSRIFTLEGEFMNWTIEYMKSDKYVKVTCKGVFLIEYLPEYFKKLFSCKYWKPGMNLLIDNQNLTFDQINIKKMRKASNDYQLVSGEFGEGKLALLMNSVVNYGFGRQFQTLSEDKGQSEIQIFDNAKKARNWMQEVNPLAE
jgi:hypothetical protein